MLSRFHDCFRMLAKLDVVTVALVRGAALGGGCELALACDFVLTSDRAKFGQPEINLGVFPPVAAYQLSRQTAPRKGLELLLTGDAIDAATAEKLGLVNAIFPQSEFDVRAGEWLQRLYRQSIPADAPPGSPVRHRPCPANSLDVRPHSANPVAAWGYLLTPGATRSLPKRREDAPAARSIARNWVRREGAGGTG